MRSDLVRTIQKYQTHYVKIHVHLKHVAVIVLCD